MALLSPNCPLHTGCECVSLCVCVWACSCVCVWCLLCFSCMLSRWQPNYYFQRYTDTPIESCSRECGSFLTGWWFMRCLCRRRFSLFFCFCFSLSVLWVIIYIAVVTEKNGRVGLRRERRKPDLWEHERRRLPRFWLRVGNSKCLSCKQLRRWIDLLGGRCSFIT